MGQAIKPQYHTHSRDNRQRIPSTGGHPFLCSADQKPPTCVARPGRYALLKRICEAKHDQFAPTFDRARDIAIAGARRVNAQTPIIVVEGNYLLLDCGNWPAITQLFDHTVFVGAPLETLERRLVKRWRDNGYDSAGAIERAQSNDIPNADLVVSRSVRADQRFCQPSDP